MLFFRRAKYIALLALALVMFSGRSGAQTPALDFIGYTPAWEYTQGSYVVGWYFQPVSAVSISALGWYNDSDGLIDDHPVGIYDIAAGRFIASTTVLKTDPLFNLFRYHDLTAPVVLQAGRQYALVGVSFRDHYFSFTPSVSNLVLDPRITHLGATANGDNDSATTQLGPPKRYEAGQPYWTVTNMIIGAVPAVAISGISPATAKVNSAAFQMTISGAGFAGNSSVRFNNTAVSVVSATSSALVVNVPANLLTTARTYNVTVVTGGKSSNAMPFRVTSATVNNTPPNLKIVGSHRTGIDPFSGTKYSVLLLENTGGADITNIALSDVRFYFDRNRPTLYVKPTNMILETGASPPGNLSRTAPGELLQIRWEWPATIIGPVQSGNISIRGTSNEGAINAGTRYLVFP